jgi:hypothetical protein
MSFVNWLSNYRSLRPPRTRRTCDYCNQPQRALVMRYSSKLRLTTRNAHCQDAYLVAVYAAQRWCAELLGAGGTPAAAFGDAAVIQHVRAPGTS